MNLAVKSASTGELLQVVYKKSAWLVFFTPKE